MSLDHDRPSGYGSFTMTKERAHVWHPWLRIEHILRAILTEQWSSEAWNQIRKEIPTLL